MSQPRSDDQRDAHDLRIRALPADVASLRQYAPLLFGHVEASARSQQISHLYQQCEQSSGACGLFVAEREDEPCGAVAWYIQPGKTGIVTSPGLATGEPFDTATLLLDAACEGVRSHPARLVFLTIESNRHYLVQAAETAGFQHLANLVYMVSTCDDFPEASPRSGLVFRPYGEIPFRDFARLVEATYEDTRDCPALNGLRDIDDVLAGYRTIGQSPGSLWYIISYRNRLIGCLLLGDHPDTESLELVYMGLVKLARGRGFGLATTRFAQWIGCQLARRSLLLAVDEANEPALHTYGKAGFCGFERRLVFMRLLAEPQ